MPRRRAILGSLLGVGVSLAGCTGDGAGNETTAPGTTVSDTTAALPTESTASTTTVATTSSAASTTMSPTETATTTATVDGTTPTSTTGVETTTVSMVDGQFDPRNVHVEQGATVTWVNDDSYSHTVTSASTNWSKDTEVEGGGETTHTFNSDGVYDVYCEFHGSADPLSGMSMKLSVGDATIQEPLGTTTTEDGGDGGDGGGGYY